MLAGVYTRSIVPGLRLPVELKTPTFQVSGLGCGCGNRFRCQAWDLCLYLNTRTRYLMAETRDLRMHTRANPPVSGYPLSAVPPVSGFPLSLLSLSRGRAEHPCSAAAVQGYGHRCQAAAGRPRVGAWLCHALRIGVHDESCPYHRSPCGELYAQPPTAITRPKSSRGACAPPFTYSPCPRVTLPTCPSR